MNIRKTTHQDIDRLMEIFAYARKFMIANGNPNQWSDKNWPPRELIKKDIANEKSYVCLNDYGEIIGTFFFDYGQDVEETYLRIYDGDWIGNNEYGVIHRIAGDGSQKGIGAFCINWAFDQCKHLRIDTHVDNKVMQNLLEKLGFTKCGIIHVKADPAPRYAYEKLVLGCQTKE